MARKGVSKGKSWRTHELTEAKQGKFNYVYGPYAEPVLHIKPGDRVIAETQDAFEGAIKTVDDLPSAKLTMPFVNPQCGPIAVEGAEKGDVLCVHIESIEPRGPQPVGTSALDPGIRRPRLELGHRNAQPTFARARDEIRSHAQRHQVQQARSRFPTSPSSAPWA